MWKLILIYLLIYTALMAGVFLIAYFVLPTTATWDEWVKVVGVGLTLIAALSGVVISLYSVEKQRTAAIELVNTQNTLAQDIKMLESHFARDLEYMKNRLTAQTKGYGELYQAASSFYYTLASLQIGEWDPLDVASAKKRMIRASGCLPGLDQKVKDVWWCFWQEGTYIIGIVKKPDTDGKTIESDPHALKALWERKAKEFGSLLEQLEVLAYPAPPSEPTKPTR